MPQEGFRKETLINRNESFYDLRGLFNQGT